MAFIAVYKLNENVADSLQYPDIAIPCHTEEEEDRAIQDCRVIMQARAIRDRRYTEDYGETVRLNTFEGTDRDDRARWTIAKVTVLEQL